MKLKITKGYKDKLNAQVKYIAKDKPMAARRFKNQLISQIKKIPEMPFGHRKSIFFNREDIRDLVFKGYISVYKIDQNLQVIEVFGFNKYMDDLFDEF
ncbi:MAG: type II toxin-antitoxin system RelE/ParE family toxin [Cyclobacteriaceae bacterium]